MKFIEKPMMWVFFKTRLNQVFSILFTKLPSDNFTVSRFLALCCSTLVETFFKD